MSTSPARTTNHRAAKAVACVGVTVLLWASAFPAIRAALIGFGPGELAALRFAVASIALGSYVILRRPPLPRRADLPRLALAGVFGIAAYNLLLNSGERTVDAGTASFLINTSPVFTALLSVALLRERIRLWGWLGLGLSFVGVTVIATGHSDLRFSRAALLVLSAAACQALQFVLQKPVLARSGALPVTTSVLWIGAAFLVPFLPSSIVAATKAPESALVAVVFLGLGPAALAYLAWSYALSHMPVSRAATFLYLVPLVATLLAWLWMGEVPGYRALVGGSIALAGVILVNTIGRNAPKAR
jgi:drug/metabolite transporter (DMT)-like permease